MGSADTCAHFIRKVGIAAPKDESTYTHTVNAATGDSDVNLFQSAEDIMPYPNARNQLGSRSVMTYARGRTPISQAHRDGVRSSIVRNLVEPAERDLDTSSRTPSFVECPAT